MKKTLRTIRILLISPYFAPHIGGSQRYMEELYVHLRNLYPYVSLDVLTYNTDNVSKKEMYRGIIIYRIPCWEILRDQFAIPNPIALCIVLYKLAQNKYNFVHTHLRFFDATWWAWLYARIIGAKSIFTEHVSNHPVHENPTVEFIAHLVDKTVAGWTMPLYDIVTVTNKSARAFLNRAYHLPQSIRLIYGGVDTSYFKPNNQKKRYIPILNKQLKTKDTVITFIGRLIWAKGVFKLYKAFCNLPLKLRNNTYLIIAGIGPLAENIQKQILKDKLEDKVLFLGALKPEQVKTVLQATNIFVHPSHHNEGFPNVILEAGATGTYTIATDVAGVREVIIPNKTGTLIHLHDEKALTKALKWAISHKKETKRMGKNLRTSFINNFDWNQISTLFMKLLISNV